MPAAALTLLLFSCWWFLGYGVLSALRRGHLLQNMLLAPPVGTSVCVMFVFWLNRGGIPISKFGPALGICLFLGSVLLWRRSHAVVPIRQYLPFAVMIVFAFVLIAWPMFKYGFNWVSTSNDDMANYCLAAQRLSMYGYFESLPPNELAKNIDVSAYYIFLANAGARMGSEMLLAFVMSLTRLTSHQAFMPLIVSLHLSLLSASGSLLLQYHRFRGRTLMALAILSCSAAFTLGTIYQLIAQVFGLSLIAACAVLLMMPDARPARSSTWKQAGLVALVFSAAMVVYTEIIPFLVCGCILYWAVQLWRSRFLPGAPALLLAALLTVLFLNSYLSSALRFMAAQAQHGSGNFAGIQDAPVLFPFFLLPSGLGQFWGFAPFNSIASEPYLSAGIVLGGILLVFSLAVSLLEVAHGVPVAFITAGMFAAAIVLAFKQSDYGLFKLAMFIQPFLIPTLVSGWMRVTEKKQSVRIA